MNIPANAPAKDFWSVVAYDPQTRSELQTGQPFPSQNNKRDQLIPTPMDLWLSTLVTAQLKKDVQREYEGRGLLDYRLRIACSNSAFAQSQEMTMRFFGLSALAVIAFSTAMMSKTPEANAVVYCAAGVVRAGCVVRPVVRRPVVVTPGVGVRGVARRTTRRVVRRSDMMLKHDIFLIGHLENGLGFYRFTYNGGDKAYVGVMAQEVQTVVPAAVLRGRDGYLRVSYDKLGVRFQTYDRWIASGAHVPAGVPIAH